MGILYVERWAKVCKQNNTKFVDGVKRAGVSPDHHSTIDIEKYAGLSPRNNVLNTMSLTSLLWFRASPGLFQLILLSQSAVLKTHQSALFSFKRLTNRTADGYCILSPRYEKCPSKPTSCRIVLLFSLYAEAFNVGSIQSHYLIY